LFISPKPEEKNNFVTEGNWNIESFNWKSTERTIKKNGRYRLEHRYWSTKKSSNFSVPYGVLYRGEGNILKRGTVVFKLNLLGMEWQRFLKEAFFFFKDVTKKRALIFFWVITKKRMFFVCFRRGNIERWSVVGKYLLFLFLFPLAFFWPSFLALRHCICYETFTSLG
jgi:hypothetical protein